MPCYLFTYHAYGSWLPDRQRGYVKRGQGVLPRDMSMHRLYVKSMAERAVGLQGEQQQTLIESLLGSAAPQRYELHAVATDASHVHALLAWRDDREAVHCRGIVKSSLSRALNGRFGKRTWLAAGGSRKHIRDQPHFDHLVGAYLPKHAGWKWDRARGMYR